MRLDFVKYRRLQKKNKNQSPKKCPPGGHFFGGKEKYEEYEENKIEPAAFRGW